MHTESDIPNRISQHLADSGTHLADVLDVASQLDVDESVGLRRAVFTVLARREAVADAGDVDEALLTELGQAWQQLGRELATIAAGRRARAAA